MTYIIGQAYNYKVGNKKPTQQKQKKHIHNYIPYIDIAVHYTANTLII